MHRNGPKIDVTYF